MTSRTRDVRHRGISPAWVSNLMRNLLLTIYESEWGQNYHTVAYWKFVFTSILFLLNLFFFSVYTVFSIDFRNIHFIGVSLDDILIGAESFQAQRAVARGPWCHCRRSVCNCRLLSFDDALISCTLASCFRTRCWMPICPASVHLLLHLYKR